LTKPVLKLDWCSHEAAKYAVEHWHYSRSLPAGKTVRVGVWENRNFIGCVIFARGAAKNLGTPYGLEQTQICELARMALAEHKTPVSKIMAIAVKMVSKAMPSIRIIVSFADKDQRHHGGIYQACNWIYTGETGQHWLYKNKRGRVLHPRQVSVTGLRPKFGVTKQVDKISECEKIRAKGKHRYLMPLDPEMRAKVLPLAKPYPKRAGSADSGTSDYQSEGGGANPTSALSIQGCSA
jgi:hypothetical protein